MSVHLFDQFVRGGKNTRFANQSVCSDPEVCWDGSLCQEGNSCDRGIAVRIPESTRPCRTGSMDVSTLPSTVGYRSWGCVSKKCSRISCATRARARARHACRQPPRLPYILPCASVAVNPTPYTLPPHPTLYTLNLSRGGAGHATVDRAWAVGDVGLGFIAWGWGWG